MKISLQNDQVTATLKAQGAELCSLTDQNGTEYIWTADPEYWGRHTPILFPLVGKVLNNEYRHQNTSYSLGQHGFARDMVFEVVEQSATAVTFKLSSNKETKKLYPFDFNLFVIYTLTDKTLEIGYRVENTDTTTIGFKIGAHPGFRCPLDANETFEDYAFIFEKEENATLMPLTSDGYFTDATASFNKQQIDLTHDVFANDALVLTNLSSKWIDLRSRNTNKGIRLNFEGFPFLGLWSPAKPSPFVCIEPWFGHADTLSELAEFMSKRDIVTLDTSQTFTCMHSVTVL